MKISTHSFDIFDTCLVRIWAQPDDLFWELGDRLISAGLVQVTPAEWAALRSTAESNLRKNTPSHEVTLGEIYQSLATHLNWTPVQMTAAREQEISLELSSLRPVPQILDEIKTLHRAGEQIIYLSDMYLPRSVLESALQNCGFPIDGCTVYTSGEIGANKAGGGLYAHCLTERRIHPRSVRHVGDNLHSDVTMASSAGMRSRHYGDAMLSRYEQKIMQLTTVSLPLRSRVAGAARIVRLQGFDKIKKQAAIWQVGAGVAGPLLFGYVHWSLEQAMRRGVKRLYFVARDGQILLKIARIICAAWDYPIDCRYLYGSRHAWHLPAIETVNDDVLTWIMDDTWFLSVRSVMDRVNLKPEDFKGIILSQGFPESGWDRNLDADQRGQLRRIFTQPELVKHIMQVAAAARELAVGYFRQEGLGDRVPFAIVDIGWRGRLQASLETILRLGGMKNPECGYYFALHDVKKGDADRWSAFFYDDRRPGDSDEFLNRAMVEIFVCADHGSNIGFARRGDVYTPVLREQRNERALAWGMESQQLAICEFASQFCQMATREHCSSADFLEIGKTLLYEFLRYPTRDEADAYGTFTITEDQSEQSWYEIAPKCSLWVLLGDYLALRKLHHNVWYPGFRTRTGLVAGAVFRTSRLSRQIISHFR